MHTCSSPGHGRSSFGMATLTSTSTLTPLTPLLPRQRTCVPPAGKLIPWNFTRYGDTSVGKKPRSCCRATKEELSAVERDRQEASDGYLVREYGWQVRRMVPDGEEMRSVAQVQAEAFHIPVALFNDLFFEFFKDRLKFFLPSPTNSEIRHPTGKTFFTLVISQVCRGCIQQAMTGSFVISQDSLHIFIFLWYACLVAEAQDASKLPWNGQNGLVGVVDVTVQNEQDVLRHLKSTDEYLYVSGIAVLEHCRRQRVATVLLKACDILSGIWKCRHLALRAYDDDSGAQRLYASAGFKVVSRDPNWITWFGQKRRVLMIKQCQKSFLE